MGGWPRCALVTLTYGAETAGDMLRSGLFAFAFLVLMMEEQNIGGYARFLRLNDPTKHISNNNETTRRGGGTRRRK